MAQSEKNLKRLIFLRIVLVLGFIALGIGLRYGFAALRKPPNQAPPQEITLKVDVVRVFPEDVPVTITGYGDVKSLNIVQVSPLVPGEVVEVHPRLEQGAVIPKGELLFRIDPKDYEIAKTQAEAQVAQLTSALELLKKRFAIDQERLATFDRTREIAKSEFDRDKALYEEDDVGTESMVNLSEVNFNQAEDAHTQLVQALKLYPLRIREAESGLTAAEAQLDKARISLERTEVRVEFTARVKMVQIEVGQVVGPGVPLLVLADDSMLEISVPLDSVDARKWLRFRETTSTQEDTSWFGKIEPVECNVSWTEDMEGHFWKGVLDRVERFDPLTRTVTVAIRVDGKEAALATPGLPLVDGMFCAVEIPGKTMEGVYRLPRWAVSFDNKVFVAEKDGSDGSYRLRRRTVTLARTEGDEAFVSSGLSTGELAVTTRLVNPLPDSLLKLSEPIDQTSLKGDAPRVDIPPSGGTS